MLIVNLGDHNILFLSYSGLSPLPTIPFHNWAKWKWSLFILWFWLYPSYFSQICYDWFMLGVLRSGSLAGEMFGWRLIILLRHKLNNWAVQPCQGGGSHFLCKCKNLGNKLFCYYSFQEPRKLGWSVEGHNFQCRRLNAVRCHIWSWFPFWIWASCAWSRVFT